MEEICVTLRKRGAKDIAERKKTLASALCDVAELGVDRMAQKIGKASLRDATIATGVSVDKMLALTNQMPAVAVQVVIPTAEERAERDEIHAKLDEITARLRSA